MSNYRFDGRSKTEFKSDMLLNHKKEAIIAVRLGIFLNKKTKKWPKVSFNGVGEMGSFIEKNHEVKCEPDYLINGKKIEITRSNNVCKRSFHEKCNKVDSYIKNGHSIVFVNGIEAEQTPKFILLSAKDLQIFTNAAIQKYGKVMHPAKNGSVLYGKQAYRYDIEWFKDMWKVLPALTDDVPKEYLALMGQTNEKATNKSTQFRRKKIPN